MTDVSLEMLMTMTQRLLEDMRLMKDSMVRVERFISRVERRDAENLAMHAETRIGNADHGTQLTELKQRLDRIERRLDLSETPT
jgi:hypothetical protein